MSSLLSALSSGCWRERAVFLSAAWSLQRLILRCAAALFFSSRGEAGADVYVERLGGRCEKISNLKEEDQCRAARWSNALLGSMSSRRSGSSACRLETALAKRERDKAECIDQHCMLGCARVVRFSVLRVVVEFS